MRMRRKRHLSERLTAVDNWIVAAEEKGFYFNPDRDCPKYLALEQIFGKVPVELEIGCGKGCFIDAMAENNRDVGFLAVERISNVLVCAAETARVKGRENLRFLNVSAENLLYWIPPNEIRTIYLNFSCPYPKKSYANHRLTHPKFLRIYREILIPGGRIVQKTDNRDFFEYSLASFRENGFGIDFWTEDVYRANVESYPTEYEKKFAREGKPICYAEISLKKE